MATVLGGHAHAGSIFRQGVPDFDQVRSTLPGTGNFHCVPTSACDLLAYVANNGLPGVFGGPADWQSQTRYAYVTGIIDQVAMDMQTDPAKGTNSKKARDGLNSWLEDTAPGVFTVSTYHGYVRLPDLFNIMADNRLTMICYGRYTPDASGVYARTGGHCVALTGMLDVDVPGVAPRLRFRDPASADGDDTLQSTFTSRVSRASLRNWNTSSGQITRWELIDLSGPSPTTRRLLDTHITIRSRYAIWPSPLNGSWVRYERISSVRAQGGTPPLYNTPGNRPVEQMALAPTGDVVYYTTVLPPGPDPLPSLYRQNVVTGQAEQLALLDRYTPLETDRFGDLYMFRAGRIRRYDAGGAGLTELASFVPIANLAPEALRWDDKRDLLFALGGGTGLQLLDRSLAGQGSYSLPSGVVLNGTGRFDITPAGTFIIGSANSPTIYHVRFNALLPRLDLVQTITIPGVSQVRAIQVTETGTGLLCVMTNAGVREYVRNAATGLWEPNPSPAFDAVPAGTTLLVSKGRTNFVAGVHDTPEWNDVLLPETSPEIPDCAVDIDLDGLRTIDDIFVFINRWFAGERIADFDESGQRTIDDIFIYINAWFVGC